MATLIRGKINQFQKDAGTKRQSKTNPVTKAYTLWIRLNRCLIQFSNHSSEVKQVLSCS